MAREPSATISDFTIDADIQVAGFLWKKPTSGKTSRWVRRYCVLKDGFFLYYADKKPETDSFDPHVKGAIPLGGCNVEVTEGEPKKGLRDCAFVVTHSSFGTRSLILGAESTEERDRWMAAIRDARHVTFAGALQGAAMIEKLRSEGRHVTAQLEVVADQLQLREEQLILEVGKRASLEEALDAMRASKHALEERLQKLLQERAASRAELLETTSALEQVTAALHEARAAGAQEQQKQGQGQEQEQQRRPWYKPKSGQASGAASSAGPGAGGTAGAATATTTGEERATMDRERTKLQAEIAAAKRERAELQVTLAELEAKRSAAATAAERANEASAATQRELGEAQASLARVQAAVAADVDLAPSLGDELAILRKFVQLKEEEEYQHATARLASEELEAIRQRTRASRAVFRAAERRSSVVPGGVARGPLAEAMARK